MTKTSSALGRIGKPLSPVQVEKFNTAMRRIESDLETARERERKAPRLNFIARAKRAGFTAEQSEFLWDNRHIPGPRLIG